MVHMRTIVVDHPLVQHKVTMLRDINTTTPNFRRLVDELVVLLAFEATRHVAVIPSKVTTPLATTSGVSLRRPAPVIIPILRAGLGMLDGFTRLMPNAEVGFLGMARDEHTLQPTIYADRMPANMRGRQVFLVDPMLATGGSMSDAAQLVWERGATDITMVTLFSVPEGIERLETDLVGMDATLVTAVVDERLDANGFIYPGLGDAGDRLFGVVL